jgi:endonuclease/exonuclease/phosphatase family metal-dependent hydrolase
MLSRMARINDTGKPMIYAGDFNSGVHRPRDSPGVKMRAAGFSDTVGLAKHPINADINSGHTFATTVLRSGDYVDHIWVSKDFEVLGWKQLVRITGGRYTRPVVSDHNALSAIVALDAPNKAVGEPTPITTVGGLSTSLG